jgi:hypothetical protein
LASRLRCIPCFQTGLNCRSLHYQGRGLCCSSANRYPWRKARLAKNSRAVF